MVLLLLLVPLQQCFVVCRVSSVYFLYQRYFMLCVSSCVERRGRLLYDHLTDLMISALVLNVPLSLLVWALMSQPHGRLLSLLCLSLGLLAGKSFWPRAQV